MVNNAIKASESSLKVIRMMEAYPLQKVAKGFGATTILMNQATSNPVLTKKWAAPKT